MFDVDDAAVATITHDLHRMRRGAYASFFSKQSVRTLEPTIQSAVDKLCSRLEESKWKGKTVNILHAYVALTADVITGYCFSQTYNFLDNPEFGEDFHNLMKTTSGLSHLLKQFGWLSTLMHAFPPWILEKVNPMMHGLVNFQNTLILQINDIMVKRDQTTSKEILPPTNIFEAILDSNMPASEKSIPRLSSEAQVLVAAGTVTTAATLTIATYHVLTNHTVLASLMDELSKVIPDTSHSPLLGELEKFPYLTAIMYEGLRISYGTSHRLQRIAPDQAIGFHDWSIPPGTPVGMTAVLIHNDPDIFPDPYTFKPERWLPIETEGQRLQKYLVPFSKGSRICVGMNLAHAEILLTMATIFRKFGNEMRICDTIWERDIQITRDYFNPLPKKESKGVFVRFAGEKD